MEAQTRESKKYRLPWWALYMFVYSDASGLEDDEIAIADAFFEREGLSFAEGCFDIGNPQEPEFYPWNSMRNLGEDCVDVTWNWFS